MSSSNTASLSVYVLDDRPEAAAVQALVVSWTRSGILTPSLWVTPASIQATASGPPTVRAWHVNTSGQEDVDLFEFVGRYRVNLVRLVSAHLISHDSDPDVGGAQSAARDVAEALAAVLPRRTDSSADGTTLHRSVVVVPASGVTGASSDVFEPAWETNVVISPEDRADLDRASVFVRWPGNFAGHAAAALAALGGILRGVPSGVLDDITSDSTSHVSDTLVVRISIRSVVGEDVLDLLARRVTSSDALAGQGPAQVLTWARVATRPDLIVDEASRYLLEQEGFRSDPPPPQHRAAKKYEGFQQVARTAAEFNMRTAGAVTSWFLSQGRSGVERRATDAMVGKASGTFVTLGPRPVGDLTSASAQLLQRERLRLDDEVRMQATRVSPPAPATWSVLRSLAFGLVDGGKLGNFPEPRQAGKRELLPPERVVVTPGDSWTGRHGEVIHADDPRQMREYRILLAEERAHLRGALEQARATTAQAGHDPFSVEQEAWDRLGPGESPAQDGSASRSDHPRETPALQEEDGTDAVTGSPPGDAADSSAPRGPELDARIRDLTVAHRELSEHVERYEAWFSERESSLLWRIADAVGDRASRLAQRNSLTAATDAQPQVPPAGALHDAQRTLMGMWKWTLPLTLLLNAIVVMVYWAEIPERAYSVQFELDHLVYLILGITLVGASILAVSNHIFFRAVQRYEWQLEQRLTQLRNSRLDFLYSGQEAARLESLYTALRDWVRILGEVIHHPWSALPNQYEELPKEVVDALPAAMGVAHQFELEAEVSQPITIEAYSIVYPPGWCTRHFDLSYEAWEGASVGGQDQGYRSVDLDALDSALSPRRRFRQYWESEQPRELTTRRAQQDLRATVLNGDLVLPTRLVKRLGHFSDGVAIPEPEFYRATATENTAFAIELFTAEARQKRRHYVHLSRVWIPESARRKTQSGPIELRSCEGPTAVRVDISRRLPAGELAVFASDERDDLQPEGETSSSRRSVALPDGPWY